MSAWTVFDDDPGEVSTEDEATYIPDYTDIDVVPFTYDDQEIDTEVRPWRYVPPLDSREKEAAYKDMFNEVLFDFHSILNMTVPLDRYSITLNNLRGLLNGQSFDWKNGDHIHKCHGSLPLKVIYDTDDVANIMFSRINAVNPNPGEIWLSLNKFFLRFIDVIKSELEKTLYDLMMIFYNRIVNHATYDPGKKSKMVAYGVERYETNHQLLYLNIHAIVAVDPRDPLYTLNDRTTDFISQFSKRDSISERLIALNQLPEDAAFEKIMKNMWNFYMGEQHNTMFKNHTQFFIAVFTMLNNRIEFEITYM